MRVMRLIKSELFSAGLALLVLSACQTAKPVATQPQIHNVTIGPHLPSSIKVISYTQRMAENNLLEAQAQLYNDSRSPVNVRYQLTWFDSGGFKLGISRWSSRLLQGGETAELTIIAPEKNATSSRILLNE